MFPEGRSTKVSVIFNERLTWFSDGPLPDNTRGCRSAVWDSARFEPEPRPSLAHATLLTGMSRDFPNAS
jgi:hypothetical protein